MTTMTSPSVDFVRKDNAYRAALKDVQEKIDRSRDTETREFSDTLFESLYPEYGNAAEWLGKRKGEITELKVTADKARAVHESIVGFDTMSDEGRKAAQRPASAIMLAGETLGGELMKTATWRQFKTREIPVLNHSSNMVLKALFETSSGYPPESTRSGVHVELPQRRLGLIDIVPSESTVQDTYKFMRETTNTAPTNMQIAQGAVYPESTFVWEQAEQSIVKLGSYVQATEEVLEDEPSARGRIDRGLMGQIRRRVETQIWSGSGAANNMRGFSNVTDVQTLDASMPRMNFREAVATAAEMVWNDGEAEADFVVVHSSDWTKWSVSQESGGAFIYSDPAVSPRRELDDIPVIRSNVVPEGQALVGAFNMYSLLVDRRDTNIRMQESQNAPSAGGSTVPTGRINIYGDVRATLAVLRGPAFCHISNITF